MISSLVSTVTRTIRPVSPYLLFGSTYPFTFHLRQRAFSFLESDRLVPFSRSLFPLSFTRPLIFIRHERVFSFTSSGTFDIITIIFLFLTETHGFTFIFLLRRVSRVRRVFSLFTHAPFAVTGRPRYLTSGENISRPQRDTLWVLRAPGDTTANTLAYIEALIDVLMIYYNYKTRDYHILGLLHVYFLIIFHLLRDSDIFYHCLMFCLMFASWPSSFLVLCLSKHIYTCTIYCYNFPFPRCNS